MIAALHQPLSVGSSSPSEVPVIPAPMQTFPPSFQTLLRSPTSEQPAGVQKRRGKNPEPSPPHQPMRFGAGGDPPFLQKRTRSISSFFSMNWRPKRSRRVSFPRQRSEWGRRRRPSRDPKATRWPGREAAAASGRRRRGAAGRAGRRGGLGAARSAGPSAPPLAAARSSPPCRLGAGEARRRGRGGGGGCGGGEGGGGGGGSGARPWGGGGGGARG